MMAGIITCPCCGQMAAAASFLYDSRSGTLSTSSGIVKVVSPIRRTLLRLLADAGGALVTRDKFIREMYAPHNEPAEPDEVLKVQMCLLRKEIRPLGVRIETIWSEGYRLDPFQPSSSFREAAE
ncbi:winged helix-turn-helix domain-containing protein [Xanthobacter autotrophicus]|uniref:winged helix-turn-helix domain-containing protein n=1 Tax=Xanthobacter autotrophicus TaxID=280 RepID=UPI00372D158A